MALLKILFLFLIIGKEAKPARCQPSEDYYYYTDEISEKPELNPTKISPDNELTHVRTKNLSGNVKLTTLQVLTTNTPLDKLNVEFENEEEDITDAMGKFGENKQDQIQTIPENRENVGLLSDLRTKAPTDGMESFALMDVFNGTSGTLPDLPSTEKLITVVPLNFEVIHATTSGLHDESLTRDMSFDREFVGAKSTQTADSKNFTEKGTTAEVSFIGGISTSVTTDSPERNTGSLDGFMNEKSSTFHFTTTQPYFEEFGVINKTGEMESFQKTLTVMTTSYQDQFERFGSLNDDGFTAITGNPSIPTQFPVEDNNDMTIIGLKDLTTENEIESLIVNTANNIDQSREDIENLSSFIDVDEELLKIASGNEENLNVDESIEDVSMILTTYDEENDHEETTAVKLSTLATEQMSTATYENTKGTTEASNSFESHDLASSLNFEETTGYDFNYLKQTTAEVDLEKDTTRGIRNNNNDSTVTTEFHNSASTLSSRESFERDYVEQEGQVVQQSTDGRFEYSSTPLTVEEFTFTGSSQQNLLTEIAADNIFTESESASTEFIDKILETTTNVLATTDNIISGASSRKYEDTLTTSVSGSEENYFTKNMQKTYDTSTQKTAQYTNELTDFIVTSNYLSIRDTTIDTSSPSYETTSSEILHTTDGMSDTQRNAKALNGGSFTGDNFYTSTDFSEQPHFSSTDTTTAAHETLFYTDTSGMPEEFEINVEDVSTFSTIRNNEDNIAKITTSATTLTPSKEREEPTTSEMSSGSAMINSEHNFITTTRTYESTSSYGLEDTNTTASYDEKLKDDLITLLTEGITNFFETLVEATAGQIETSSDDEHATTIVYSTFKNIINKEGELGGIKEDSFIHENADKVVDHTSTIWELEGANFETVTKEEFFTSPSDVASEIKENSKHETSTINLRETFFNITETTVTQGVKMSTIGDSFFNSVNEKRGLTINTPEKIKTEMTEPQVTAKMDGKTLYFSIKITDNETSFFVPSDAFLTVLSPNTVNITWKSATTAMNNSLQLTLGNSVQLNVVKGTRMHIHKSALIPEPENKLDVDTNLITMDDGTQIYFSNTEFLKKDQDNQNAFTADALPSAPTQTQALAAEIIGGCMGVLVIATILIYCAIKKYRTKTRNFKPNDTV